MIYFYFHSDTNRQNALLDLRDAGIDVDDSYPYKLGVPENGVAFAQHNGGEETTE